MTSVIKSVLREKGRAERSSRCSTHRISFQNTIVTKTTMVEKKLVEFDECFAKEELAALVKHNNLQADFEKGTDLDLVSKRYDDLIAVQFATQQFDELPQKLQADITKLLFEVHPVLKKRHATRVEQEKAGAEAKKAQITTSMTLTEVEKMETSGIIAPWVVEVANFTKAEEGEMEEPIPATAPTPTPISTDSGNHNGADSSTDKPKAPKAPFP